MVETHQDVGLLELGFLLHPNLVRTSGIYTLLTHSSLGLFHAFS